MKILTKHLCFLIFLSIFIFIISIPIVHATSDKVNNVNAQIYEDNIGLSWDKYNGSEPFNAYAVFIKKGADFTNFVDDYVNPIYVSPDKNIYTFHYIDKGVYYFKVGVGQYDTAAHKFISWGKFSDSVKVDMSMRQTSPDKISIDEITTKQNGIYIKWSAYKGTRQFNAYAVFLKLGSDFTTVNLQSTIKPIYIPANQTDYLITNNRELGNYYVRVGIGNYSNGKFTDYVDLSDTNKILLNQKPFYRDPVLTHFSVRNFPDTEPGLLNLAANELFRRGVANGYSDGKFNGDNQVNRAEALKFLLRTKYYYWEGQAPYESTKNIQFKDVGKNDWFWIYVAIATDNSAVNGYSDNTFKPGNTINTAEFLKMMSGVFTLAPLNQSYTYSDVHSNDWFSKYAGFAQSLNLFPDRKDKLLPDKILTRKEVVIAIYQFLANFPNR